MRGKKTIINTIFALIEELIAIISGFILPSLILSAFGSKYNGLTTSITQFLSCAVLLRSGIGGATRAALYKPLAEKNKEDFDAIIKATDNFMKKIGALLAIAILVFSLLYPFFVKNDFNYFFTFSLFLIIGLSTFAESFFGITYLIVLQADQKLWISSIMKSICYILNVILAAILIFNGFGIHIVKLGSALVYVLYPIVLQIYVRKKYNINTKIKPNNSAISQRWNAFWHQVATFVMNNTDIIILTIFSNMLEVSVYSVYNLVVNGLKRLIASFSQSLEAAFGNMIAKKENKVLNENFSIIELLIYSISTISCTTAIITILQFVKIYTSGINDVDYLQPTFAYILLIAQFFSCVRIPYQILVQAAGHYKQTKLGAILEPIINLLLSIILVIKYGLIGVSIGTLVATLIRTIQYSIYASKNIIKRNKLKTIFRFLVSITEMSVIIIFFNILKLDFAQNYFEWIINAIFVFVVSIIIVTIFEVIIYNKNIKLLKSKIHNALRNKRKNNNLEEL